MSVDRNLPELEVQIDDLPQFFSEDKTKDGWKLLRDTDFDGPLVFSPQYLLREDESSVCPEEVLERITNFDVFPGQRHAEFILRMQTFPLEWKRSYMIFLGTMWQKTDGEKVYPVLLESLWEGWTLKWSFEVPLFISNDRLVCLR